MGNRLVRLAGAIGVLAAVFVTTASGASANPPDPTCQTNAVVRSIMYMNGVAYLAGDFTQVAPAGATIGGAGTVTRHGLAACNETTGAILATATSRCDHVGSAPRAWAARSSSLYRRGWPRRPIATGSSRWTAST